MRIIFVKLKRKKYDELSIRATIYCNIAWKFFTLIKLIKVSVER